MRSCLLCQSPVQKICDLHEFDLFECGNCSHRMTFIESTEDHIVRNFDDEYFLGGGAGYPNYHGEKELLMKRGEQYSDILEKLDVHPGSLLDAGCAAGYMLGGFRKKGWKVLGVEPNKKMAAFAKDTMNLEVVNSSLEEMRLSRSFEVITMVQVLAHFVDPSKALDEAMAHLQPNGIILIETWNYKSLIARVLGKNWHEYSPPTVLHWFCPSSLDYLLANKNCELIARGKLRKTITWEHAKSLLEYKFQKKPVLAKFLKLFGFFPGNLNLPYPFNDHFYAIYKKKESANV